MLRVRSSWIDHRRSLCKWIGSASGKCCYDRDFDEVRLDPVRLSKTPEEARRQADPNGDDDDRWWR